MRIQLCRVQLGRVDKPWVLSTQRHFSTNRYSDLEIFCKLDHFDNIVGSFLSITRASLAYKSMTF